MKLLLISLTPLLLLAPCPPAGAQKIDINGYIDLRVVQPSDQRSCLDGGLGKLRFDGGAHNSPDLHFSEAVADVRAQLGQGLGAFATLRIEPRQKTALDMLEAYGRYQPISTTSLLWSIKLGA